MLSDDETKRYQRQLVMDSIGASGQEKIQTARVVVIGAGGLGSPAAIYLAAVGVGTLGLVDGDSVDLSNLQRQIAYDTKDIGRPKVDAARERLLDLNPGTRVRTYETRVEKNNIQEIISEYDIVVDAVDNFATRYLVNDACYFETKPLVEGGVIKWEGQVMTILPEQGPCLRCLFPRFDAEAETKPAASGVLGVMPGIIGTLQALETIKLILGAGSTLSGRILKFDGLTSRFSELKIERNPDCPLCGSVPKITKLGQEF